MTDAARDVLTPKEVADRAGFSYHAILRAIRSGDLHAFEPVRGLDRLGDYYPDSYGVQIASRLAGHRQICPSTGRDGRLERFRPASHARIAAP